MTKMNNPMQMILNAARRLDTLFPGYFPQAKHNHYRDFGYPETLTFEQFHAMYSRNGLGHAGIEKTVLKTWESFPFVLEKEEQHKETTLESDIRQRFADLRFWQNLAEADRRSMVGGYAGVIFRFADSKLFKEPVDRVSGGLEGLVEIIPAWEGQLRVSDWETDERSEAYGQPKTFAFNETAVGSNNNQARNFEVHPDRVFVWSKNGTVHNRSLLEPGYNDLLTLEKITGAGGEGFWKNAKSAPVLEIDKDVSLEEMAKAMGVPVEEIADKMDDQVDDWQKGFDKLLMLQGMQAKTLGITLPSPEHFFNISLQCFASSIPIPQKILVGMQTGERASTEDAREWSQTNMSRRENQVIPNTMGVINRLERVGILPERDWYLDWGSLMDPSPNEMLERAERMAGVNDKMKAGGEIVFTPDEMRAETGREPLTDAEKYREDGLDEPPALDDPSNQ